nr:PREDICTED: RNA-directed DNA polymerase from mobile element jockey-like [Latimeria chalumnae]|eukprot:XP_014354063.1 PREDICTED: RNA-directed DNA polymerase from mobile element jockey-like [Latimeria chalumnae]
MRSFFSATKAVYRPSSHGPTPLRSEDGSTLLKDIESIKIRWKEHYQKLLNLESTVTDDTIESIPQYPVREALASPPTFEEVCEAIRQMKNNKAPGPDGIPAEVFKVGGETMTNKLYTLLLKIWNTEEIPADLRNANIITIFKKGDKSVCGNYRGIALLSTAGKILARILLNRLLPLAEEILPESQCGFRPSRGTTDMIFVAREIQEKCQEQHQELYMAVIDLTKAFDSVNCEALWKILSRFGCPGKFITVLRLS